MEIKVELDPSWNSCSDPLWFTGCADTLEPSVNFCKAFVTSSTQCKIINPFERLGHFWVFNLPVHPHEIHAITKQVCTTVSETHLSKEGKEFLYFTPRPATHTYFWFLRDNMSFTGNYFINVLINLHLFLQTQMSSEQAMEVLLYLTLKTFQQITLSPLQRNTKYFQIILVPWRFSRRISIRSRRGP